MNSLAQYYMYQSGRGLTNSQNSGLGPIYAVPTFVQRGHGIADILGTWWRFVRHLLWTGAKTLGKETLKTGSQLLSDLADKFHNVSAHDVITASAQNLVKRLRGAGKRGRKRKNRAEGSKKKYEPK
jgi:hypothetical protein